MMDTTKTGFESMYRTFESCRPSQEGEGGTMGTSPGQYITPVTWLEAPDWLTPEEAAAITGHTLAEIQEIIDAGGVELKDGDQVLIEKGSLHDFQECLAEVLHWND